MYQKFADYMMKYIDIEELKFFIILLLVIVIALVLSIICEKYETYLQSKDKYKKQGKGKK